MLPIVTGISTLFINVSKFFVYFCSFLPFVCFVLPLFKKIASLLSCHRICLDIIHKTYLAFESISSFPFNKGHFTHVKFMFPVSLNQLGSNTLFILTQMRKGLTVVWSDVYQILCVIEVHNLSEKILFEKVFFCQK